MIQIKSDSEIAVMRRAGLVVADTLAALRAAVAPGVSTADLDDLAAERIAAAGATPSFLGYHGYPRVICTSINNEIVHGIPSAKRVLRDGDVVSIDCGAIIDGYHGDAAVTVAVGEIPADVQALLQTCEDSLWAGIAAASLGGRLTDISYGVEMSVRSHPHPGGGEWGIVQEYVGHGIGTEMHQEPQVYNYAPRGPGRGPKLVKGLALAIEPMVNLGSPATRLLDDGWTVETADGSVSAHFEHTFTLTDDGPWVLTAHDGGTERLNGIRAATGTVTV